MRFRINSPKVIHQIFDTEVVIVNLESGIYYSAGGSGIEVWRQLDAGILPRQITDAFAPFGAQSEIKSYLEELEREQLIVPSEEQAGAETMETFPSITTFVSPTLHKFTDMREMLLVDPIHELDEGGWPKPAPAQEEK